MASPETRYKEDTYKMRFEEARDGWSSGRLTQEEAAELLGISGRTFRRKLVRYEESGMEGIIDRRVSKKGESRVPADETESMLRLRREAYMDYSVRHFHEKWREEHGGTRSYNWFRLTLQGSGLAEKAPSRGKHRRKRERKPLPGMMLHQDGSRHEWIPGRQDDLIVTMDDATGEIYSMFLTEEEGTFSTFEGLRETIRKKGLFASFYTDRGSHYFTTPEAGGKADKANPTQVGRALRELRIRHIAAYSPQARGRSERAFGTLQGRLPQELRTAGAKTLDEANAYIDARFLPDFNKKFARKAREEGSAFVPCLPYMPLEDILCVREERVVKNDNTVSYKGKILQLDKGETRLHYVKCKVEVAERIDGSLAVFLGPAKIAEFPAPARKTPKNEEEPMPVAA